MNQYIVTLKPLENKGDLEFLHVDGRTAKVIKDRWDSHQNIEVGDKYISWQRIVEITAPPAANRLEAPAFCGKCENGWLSGKNGFYACSCNVKGKEEAREYSDYLNKQSWFNRAKFEANRRLDQQSLLLEADSIFEKGAV